MHGSVNRAAWRFAPSRPSETAAYVPLNVTGIEQNLRWCRLHAADRVPLRARKSPCIVTSYPGSRTMVTVHLSTNRPHDRERGRQSIDLVARTAIVTTSGMWKATLWRLSYGYFSKHPSLWCGSIVSCRMYKFMWLGKRRLWCEFREWISDLDTLIVRQTLYTYHCLNEKSYGMVKLTNMCMYNKFEFFIFLYEIFLSNTDKLTQYNILFSFHSTQIF